MDVGTSGYRIIGLCEPAAGQTLKLHIGGIGRPVIAKVIPPIGVPQPFDYVRSLNVEILPDSMADVLKSFPFSENYPDLPIEQAQSLEHQFQMKVSAAREKQAAIPGIPNFLPSTDGSIRADDVKPGRYTIQLFLFEAWEPNMVMPRRRLGEATATFTVPPTPACPTDEAFDIGTIHLQSPKAIKVGTPWPAFNLVSLDGKLIDQTSWAGKVVLIYSGGFNDRRFFPAIRRLSEKYKDKLVIVNIGMRMLPKWIQHINAKEHLSGVFAMDKDSFELNWNGSDAQILEQSPKLSVLDPNGNVAAQPDPATLPAIVDHLLADYALAKLTLAFPGRDEFARKSIS